MFLKKKVRRTHLSPRFLNRVLPDAARTATTLLHGIQRTPLFTSGFKEATIRWAETQLCPRKSKDKTFTPLVVGNPLTWMVFSKIGVKPETPQNGSFFLMETPIL